MKLIYYGTLALALLSCGQKHPPATGDPQRDPNEVVKPGQIPGSALSIGVVVDPQRGLALLLSRLKTSLDPLPVALSEEGPTIILESDAAFSLIRPLLSDYPARQSFIASSSEGNQPATVAGVALTSANCGTGWAAYPLLVTQPLQDSDAAIIVRPGDSSVAINSRRLLDISSTLPDAVQKTLERIYPEVSSHQRRLWSRFVELDGDSGAEIVVARLLFEPLTNESSRMAVVQGLWLDETNGEWSVLSKSEIEIAQEDLLRFSPNHSWERWISPPVLVVDLENDKIAEVVRESFDGYSLWRVDAGELQQIFFAALASQERCE